MKRPITTLNLPEYKIEQLHQKGYFYCEDINLETVKSEVGITVDEWRKLTEETIATITALNLCEDETIANHIVTFSSALDDVLGGGVPIQLITEFCGLPGSGKTQICLQLCVSVQLSDCFGGIEGHAVYIDTNYGFTSHRLKDMAQGCIEYCHLMAQTQNSFEMLEDLKNWTQENILKNVHYLQLDTFSELLALLHMLKKLLIQDSNIKLIVIDSITSPVKNTNLDYFERIKILYTFLSNLQKLAQQYKFAIVLTNDMTTKFDEQGMSYETPCLGDTFAHRVNCRIQLDRKSDFIFQANVVKSVLKPVQTATFQITEAGIRDME